MQKASLVGRLFAFAIMAVIVVAAGSLVFSPSRDPMETVQPQSAPVSMGSKLTPTQVRLASFIAETWRVNTEHAAEVVHAAFDAADRHAVDPMLVLAIAGKESSFRHIGNPGGGDDPRRPFGIMQVAGRWHQDKFEDGVVRKTSVAENINLGTQVVKKYLDLENGNERRALQRYNGALNQRKAKYFRGVVKIKAMFVQALRSQHRDSA